MQYLYHIKQLSFFGTNRTKTSILIKVDILCLSVLPFCWVGLGVGLMTQLGCRTYYGGGTWPVRMFFTEWLGGGGKLFAHFTYYACYHYTNNFHRSITLLVLDLQPASFDLRPKPFIFEFSSQWSCVNKYILSLDAVLQYILIHSSNATFASEREKRTKYQK